ncbi:MAG: DNA translocase FtsK [Roseburia sp.]|nr:DNA translocase FtsK [Roseburia sp.]
MAASSGRRTSASKGNNNRKKTNASKKAQLQRAAQDSAMFHEIGLIALFLVMVFCFCCNFGIIGPVGDKISSVLFGLFGFSAYAAPVLLFLAIAFWFANEGNPNALRKLIAGVVLFIMLGVVCELIAQKVVLTEKYDIKAIYEASSAGKNGGGIIGGSVAYLLQHYLETIGTVLVVLLCSVVSMILLTERSLLDSMKNGGSRLRERSREDAKRRREYTELRRQEQEEQRARREEEKRLRAEEKENEKILRMEKKVSGVMMDTALKPREEEKRRDDIHEIIYAGEPEDTQEPTPVREASVREADAPAFDFDSIRVRTAHQVILEEPEEKGEEQGDALTEKIRIHKEGMAEPEEKPAVLAKASSKPSTGREKPSLDGGASADTGLGAEIQGGEKRMPKKYIFPPLSRLQKGAAVTGDSTKELKETAMRLQQTLNTFGVRVTITDISQGPSVTRYELQPEQGVKVSKIVGLSDDIKLNLAATDIRIEAPIPGKAAIGIEVPNKENMTVALRDLLESKEFRDFSSNLAFAVGKDIAGKTVVADIAKMPHMLIAGSTGSGKSVCINTLIMSILYKAHPDDVKLIMVDPKVVELSVYNGIPHLLIPVVTDPKKASAALHWAVSEMEDRYRKFAEYNVRDLKGYNKKVEGMQGGAETDAPAKLPQIVIIVDELADLMMVSPGEVEESICRLAQLARACGIHLIIATQRPSVDVITGLIKANMPSRVAFAVSSGVDSRTILDMVGAEKLLGKGDMLFYPQGYSKPARIQGAFVSDKEVSDVVDFLKNQMLGNTYAEDIEEKIKNIGSAGPGGGGAGGGDARDEYFGEAGRIIIDKDKASIGMLQRAFKIGFNRAARIMDQLCEYGVVGEEGGTKPRKVLMSMEQFEQLLEEI